MFGKHIHDDHSFVVGRKCNHYIAETVHFAGQLTVCVRPKCTSTKRGTRQRKRARTHWHSRQQRKGNELRSNRCLCFHKLFARLCLDALFPCCSASFICDLKCFWGVSRNVSLYVCNCLSVGMADLRCEGNRQKRKRMLDKLFDDEFIRWWSVRPPPICASAERKENHQAE